MKFPRFLAVLVLVVSSAGCTSLPSAGNGQAGTETPFLTETVAPTDTPPAAQETAEGPVTLRVWLPPDFDPESESPAGDLLQARLDEFVSRRGRTRLDVRIKSLQEPGGMLDSLSTAGAAAPQAIPDLIVLPRALFEAAALKGLLHPVEALQESLAADDWYDFARQLASIDSSFFGIPFAGNALLLMYDSELVPEPPPTLQALLETPSPLAFPGADSQALFTLNLYMAAGGNVLDDQSRPSLDAEILTQVLTFYQQAETAGVVPVWTTQMENDAQAWEAFSTGQAPMVVTWATRYLADPRGSIQAVPLPTSQGMYSLSGGWVWAISAHTPEKQALALELAEFLAEPRFMAEWTYSAGYLPARAEALSHWPAGPGQALAIRLLPSMQMVPNADILSTIAPVLRQATLQAIKQQGEPAVLAQEAAARLQNP